MLLPPSSTLFPYTTLFRSAPARDLARPISAEALFMKIVRILFTTDLSAASKEAFPLALELAKAFRAKITCLHVFEDRKSTRLNSSHITISYAVFCLKKKKQ